MYLWKYWRESRISFAVGVVLVGLLLWAVLKIHVPGSVQVQGPEGGADGNASTFYLVAAAILTLPVGFMGVRFGSFGIGRDLGEGSGAFLFTRPRDRAFFVWSDWGFGMAQMLTLIAAANAVLLLMVHRVAPGSGPIELGDGTISLFTVFLLHCVAGLLLAGLMFGLTYLCSVALKNRGVLLAIGVVVVYLVARSVVKHYWPAITLPDLTLTEFSVHSVTTTRAFPNGGFARATFPAAVGFANHLGLEIAVRALIMMVFPVAAYALMEARDVE